MTLREVFRFMIRFCVTGKYLSTFLIDQGYGVKVVPDTPQSEQDISELLLRSPSSLKDWFIDSPLFVNVSYLDSLLTASFENFKRLSGGKNENSEARPPEPLTQGVGDAFTAVVTDIQSPSEILCQKLENASELHTPI